MSRSNPPLQQHLLTRSDLARLGVPAGDILAWLARGAIEQVGTLAGDGGDDPVFTAAPELRAELSARLASIGKSAVVLSPMRVRSFLLRALLQRKPVASAPPATVEAGAMTPSEALAEHLATTDLAQVLHEAANELEADVEHVLRIAEEEARLEASIGVAAAEAAAPRLESGTDPGANGIDGDEPSSDDEDEADEACFDVDDLASALGDWDDEPASAAKAREPAAPPTAAATAKKPALPVAEPAADVAATSAVAELVRGFDPASGEVAPPFAANDSEDVLAHEALEHDGPTANAVDIAVGPDGSAATATTQPVGETEDGPPVNQQADAAPATESQPAAEASIPLADEAEAEPAPPVVEMATLPAAIHVADDVTENEPEAAPALAAAPTREEPTMSAEPMATEHEDHSAPELAASEAIASAEQALEPLLHDEDQPPTFDAKEIAAALSVLDLDDGPARVPKVAAAPAVASQAAAAEPVDEAHVVAQEPPIAPPAAVAPAPEVVPPHADDSEIAAAAAQEPQVLADAAMTAADVGQAEPSEPLAAATTPTPTAATTSAPATAGAAEPTSALADDGPMLAASMQRVEAFLGELKAALVEMAGRPVATPPPPTIQVPATPPVDLAPLVGAIEGGLQKSAASSAAAATALSGLAEKLDGIGQRIERSAIAAESMAQHTNTPKTAAEPARFLVARSNPVPLTLLAVAAMVTAWSVLFWFKTGSPRLALGTLIGATLVGCVLLTPGRFR